MWLWLADNRALKVEPCVRRNNTRRCSVLRSPLSLLPNVLSCETLQYLIQMFLVISNLTPWAGILQSAAPGTALNVDVAAQLHVVVEEGVQHAVLGRDPVRWRVCQQLLWFEAHGRVEWEGRVREGQIEGGRKMRQLRWNKTKQQRGIASSGSGNSNSRPECPGRKRPAAPWGCSRIGGRPAGPIGATWATRSCSWGSRPRQARASPYRLQG